MAKFNIGRDLTITISLNGAVLAEFGLYIDTHFQPQWTEAKVRPTNNGGIFVARAIFGGYDVTLQFARVDGTGDDLFSFLEDNFVAGNTDPVITLLESVRNDDGTVDQYNYINGTIIPQDGGSFKGVDEVNETIKFFFPQRDALTSNSQPTFGGQALTS